MKVINPPQPIGELAGFSVFLAGSIEMGAADEWQRKIIEKMGALEKNGQEFTILNPRRPDWDSSWRQEMTNPQFREQVLWELKAQEEASVIAMYLDPTTKSPISLMELGLFAESGRLIVCCPEGFYRKGNVDIVCQMYRVPEFEDIDSLIAAIVIRENRLSVFEPGHSLARL